MLRFSIHLFGSVENETFNSDSHCFTFTRLQLQGDTMFEKFVTKIIINSCCVCVYFFISNQSIKYAFRP